MNTPDSHTKTFDIIYLCAGSLGQKLWINTHRVGLQLAEKNRVLFVEEPSRSYLGILFKGNGLRAIIKSFKGIESRGPNLTILTPLHVLPSFLQFGIFKTAGKFFQQKLLVRRIRQVTRQLAFQSPLLWIYYIENQHYFIGKLGESMVVYDCVDEISAFPRFRTEKARQAIRLLEQDVLQKSGVVFTISKNLMESKKKINPHTYYVPNVAEFVHFNIVDSQNLAIPDDIAALSRPILGYIGALTSYRIDFNLINYIAQRHSDWSIVLIGPVGEMTPDNRLLKRDNVYCLGTKDYQTLPQYIKAFDVCLLPYVLNEYTRYNFPLKFWEFMATGKPIVATNTPAFDEFKDLIPVCATKDAFAAALTDSLKESQNAQKNQRIEEARKNTWEKRINTMLEHISSRIDRKN